MSDQAQTTVGDFANKVFDWLMYLRGLLRRAGLTLADSPLEQGELCRLIDAMDRGVMTRREAQLSLQSMVAWQKDGTLAQRRQDFADFMRERPDLNDLLVKIEQSARRTSPAR